MLAAHLSASAPGGQPNQMGVSSQVGSNADQGGNMLSNDGNAASSAGAQSERLKVEDALNYLDQVKYKFGNQPQIYNDFLDIMKEFKSQSIDTPGVIARVSHLFRGHPELIVGFNTFLPPGYKIEIQSNDQLPMGIIGGAGYIVTTVQTAPPGPGGHPGGQISTVIQSHNMPVVPPQRPPISNVSSNHGRISPIQSSAMSSGNNYDGPSSTFSHSSYSPFVEQNIQMQRFPSLQSQPVEFNHAINYVNKIKMRFHGQPDKYKQFLEILHTYQKEQRTIKEGQPPSAKHLTEHEVYSQVAKLFENQEDLLSEFGQFLPDATNHQNTSAIDQAKKSVKMTREFQPVQNTKAAAPPPPKRPTLQPASERKKPKPVVAPHSTKEISLVEAGRYGTLNEFAFFDKVRHALQHQDVYENFLRCLVLFNDEVISRSELIMLVNPFLGKTPDLHNWFKDFVGVKHQEPGSPYYDPVASVAQKNDNKLTEEQIIDIDFSTCKRLGASYCAMPKNNAPPKCSGRNTLPLCKEVLNDVWVSFPAWSEDTTFSSSRKTTFEECIYRVEDERFELDVVIETNGATIRIFELLIKKMARLSPEELSEFQLDDCLGGTSPTIHQRAIRRLYGDKAAEIIEGLKKQPQVAVPLVLRRLKAKEEEWRDAQKQFNKSWREQTEKYYLKSLDLQGITFKQNDVRALRSKALLLEIDTLFDERQEQLISNPGAALLGPHLTLLYRDRTVLDDACLLLLHHVRRQSSIGKDDKRRIKQLLKHFLADLFHHTRMDLSDDEDEGRAVTEEMHEGQKSPNEFSITASRTKRNGKRGNGGSAKTSAAKRDVEDAASRNEDNRNNASVDADAPTEAAGPSSTKSVWTELTQRKKLSTAQESQESRRTIAKRELKLLLSDAKSHELTNVGTTSLRDKETREYLNAISKDDGSCATAVPPPPIKRRASRRMSQHAGDSSTSQNETTHGHVQPRVISIPNPDEDEAYVLFFANSTWYSFLRLHQILCERLSKIYERSVILVKEEAKEDTKNSAAFNLKMKSRSEVEVEDYYPTFLEMIRNLLDGNMDGTLYEDTLREMFGIHAYIAYTMDKVVSNAVRQLQSLVTDDVSQKCLELYHQASKRGGTGGFYSTMSQRTGPELWYQKKAEKLCAEENCIKTMIFKKHCRMTMELLETEEPAACDVEQKAKYTAYVSKFLKPDRTIPENLRILMGDKPVFLGRNILNWKKRNLLEWISDNNKRDSGKLAVQPLCLIKEEPMDMDIEIKIEKDEDLHITKVKDAPHEVIVVKEEDVSEAPMEVDTVEEVGDGISLIKKGNQRLPVTIKVEEEEVDQSMDHLIVKTVGKSQPDRKMELVVQENLECHVDISSMKLVYLALSEDCIYLMGSLQRARRAHKRITLTKAKKFKKFHAAWLESHVTPSQISECEDFLLDPKSTPPRIMSIPWGNEDEVPYRTYNKYVMVKKPKVGHATELPSGDKH